MFYVATSPGVRSTHNNGNLIMEHERTGVTRSMEFLCSLSFHGVKWCSRIYRVPIIGRHCDTDKWTWLFIHSRTFSVIIVIQINDKQINKQTELLLKSPIVTSNWFKEGNLSAARVFFINFRSFYPTSSLLPRQRELYARWQQRNSKKYYFK